MPTDYLKFVFLITNRENHHTIDFKHFLPVRNLTQGWHVNCYMTIVISTSLQLINTT